MAQQQLIFVCRVSFLVFRGLRVWALRVARSEDPETPNTTHEKNARREAPETPNTTHDKRKTIHAQFPRTGTVESVF